MSKRRSPHICLSLALFYQAFAAPLASAQTATEKTAPQAAKTQEKKPVVIEVKTKRIQKGSAKALLDERRSSSEVKDVLSSEQISKAGDSDAASAMKRVTGLTLLGGKSIFVRGLGERYSATSLNGLSVPSPDPARRQVQFDLFPAEIFESIVVQKSYSPDLPGEFGGGAALLRTKEIPRRFQAKVTVGSGYSADKVDTYKHAGRDWIGMDNGTRSLPDSVKTPLSSNNQTNGAALEATTESFPRIYSVREQTAPANRNFSVGFGDRLDLGFSPLGYSAAMIYADEWDQSEKLQQEFGGQSYSDLNQKSNVVSSERSIKLGSIGSLGLDFSGQKLGLVAGVLRRTTDTVDRTDKESINAGTAPKQTYRLQWQERELIMRQLNGQHQLSDDGSLAVSWRVGLSNTKREIPDERSYGYTQSTGAKQRVWSEK